MSLHDLANHVQSAGRGEDKVLVHMTPGEVNGLQSLAMAHGGSLSVNPETGLPEASFLRSLLPTLIGFGLAPLTSGLSAALITGAGYTAATGSLKKGIMAGLGAYGGAGLASGLASMGASAGASAGAKAAASSIDDIALASKNAAANSQLGAGYGNITPQAQIFGQPPVNATNMGLPAYTTPAPIHSGGVNTLPSVMQPRIDMPGVFTPGSAGGTTIPAPTPGPVTISRVPSEIYAEQPAKFLTNLPQATPYKGEYFTAGKVGATTSTGAPIEVRNVPVDGRVVRTEVLPGDPAVANPQSITGEYRDYMSQVGQGAKNVYKGGVQGLKDLYKAMPDYSVAAGVGGTSMNYIDEKRKEAEEAMRRRAKQSPGMIRPYEFTYGATGVDQDPYTGSAERTYFQPTYTELTPYTAPGPEYAAEGGIMRLAVGGAVEDMAAQNAVGANTGYPMAHMQTSMYSDPSMQRPQATNIVAPSADMGVDAYTGEARFARGGGTATPETTGGYSYSYDPVTMQFTQTGAPSSAATRSFKAGVSPVQAQNAGRHLTSWNEIMSEQLGGSPALKDTPTNSAVSGGMAQPVMQPTSPAQSVMQPTSSTQSLVPNIDIPAYQTPEQQLGLVDFYKNMNQQLSGMGGYKGYAAGGGISHLGDYSDGGRLLKGPGDGVSDSIPASIGNRQPARLADGEFVVPARIVSEIGNGSTEAGARKLYAMMERVQRARRKTVGKNQVARNTKADKLLPA